MKRKEPGTLSIFELAALYEEAASLHGQGLDKGDSKMANKYHDALKPLVRELMRRGTEGQAVILNMMKSSDTWVRLSAAGNALRFAPERGEPVLEELAAVPLGTNSFTAGMILQEWRKGNLKFEE